MDIEQIEEHIKVLYNEIIEDDGKNKKNIPKIRKLSIEYKENSTRGAEVNIKLTKKKSNFISLDPRLNIDFDQTFLGVCEQAQKGLLGHELGHIKHGHLIFIPSLALIGLSISMAILSTMFIMTILHSRFILLIIPISILSIIIVILGLMFIGSVFARQNEFKADDFSKDLGYGQGLVCALKFIDAYEKEKGMDNKGSKLAEYIHRKFPLHPPIEERIKRLLSD